MDQLFTMNTAFLWQTEYYLTTNNIYVKKERVINHDILIIAFENEI